VEPGPRRLRNDEQFNRRPVRCVGRLIRPPGRIARTTGATRLRRIRL